MFDDQSTGIVLVTVEDTGLFSVHMTSNQHISSVMMEAKMILVKDKGVDRGIYYRMVTQYDRDILGDVLYHDKRPVHVLHRPLHRQTREIVSRTNQWTDYLQLITILQLRRCDSEEPQSP
jgi:hypothetical protein